MKNLLKKHWLLIGISLAGSVAGFFYWKYVGCQSGTCIIKSVWYLSTLYGLVFGYIIGSLAEDLIARFRKTDKA